MPLAGRKRKASPRTVHAALPAAPGYPKPRSTETFRAYWARLVAASQPSPGEDTHDALLVLLVSEGLDQPDQQTYLLRLEDAADRLYRVREALAGEWPK